MKPASTLSRRVRNAIFQIHLWLGLVLGLWFAYVGLTGSVLAWLPDLLPYEFNARFPYQRQGPVIPPSQAMGAMRAAYPEMKPAELNTFTYPSGNGFGYYLWSPPGRTGMDDDRFVPVDPYSGKVYPVTRVSELTLGFIAHSHSSLMLATKGLIASSVFMAFALVMLVTGIWVWWPSTMKLLRRRLIFVRGTPLIRKLYDLHNVMGIYLFIIVFVTTLTGLLGALDQLTGEGVEKAIDRLVSAPAEAPPKIAATGDRLPIDSLFTLARHAIAPREIVFMHYPTTPDGAFSAAFRSTEGGLVSGGDITLDPYTGKVLSLEGDSEGSAGHMVMHLSNDLHFGTFGGVWSKLLYTLAGLTPLGLFITGVWRWWIRRSKRTERKASAREEESTAVLAEG
jgi:uncharacterized iron-regulated membrane protein